MISPNQHEKNEWARMAQAAYSARRNDVGHRYSAAASLPHCAVMMVNRFDLLQAGYRQWLISGAFPLIVTA